MLKQKNINKKRNPKNIIKGIKPILDGSNLVNIVISPMVGSSGKLTILENRDGVVDKNTFYVTSDGTTILSNLILRRSDPRRFGIELIKEESRRLKSDLGIESSVFSIICSSLLKETYKFLAAKYDPIFLSNGIIVSSKEISNNLFTISSDLKSFATFDDIFNIALTSCKSKELAYFVARAFELRGKDGNIIIEEARTTNISLEKISGMQIDRGYTHEYFINYNNTDCLLSHPKVFITDYTLESFDHANNILKLTDKGEQLLVIAPEVLLPAFQTFHFGMMKHNQVMCIIKSPSYRQKGAQYRLQEMSEDIATYTGAELITSSKGRILDKIYKKDLGSAHSALIKNHSTILLGGSGNQEKISDRIKLLEFQSKNDKNDFDRDRAKLRLQQLNNNLITIKVGGFTDYEVKHTKQLIENAIGSCNSSLNSGVVEGSGIAYLSVLNSSKLEKPFDLIWTNTLERRLSLIEQNGNLLNNVDSLEVCQQIILKSASLVSEIIKTEYLVYQK